MTTYRPPAPVRETDEDLLALARSVGVSDETDEEAWKDRALCAETDPEAFFPDKGESTREAKRICSGCEVRAECLAYALARDERFGIWGGLSASERRRLTRAADALQVDPTAAALLTADPLAPMIKAGL